jgi:endonuclease/exonuclease/phosphatase family metal-dependent hydrolase
MPVMAILQKFAKRIFIVSNTVCVILFLLACANGFLHPSKWWVISLLSLFFPLLLLLVFAFLVFWLCSYTRSLALLSGIALVIGWPNIHSFFAFHPAAGFDLKKPAGALRVLTWNVRSWDEFITKKAGTSGHRAKMMEFLGDQNADLMCFQEFFESHNTKEIPPAISYIRNQLHYPYYFFSRDYQRKDGLYETGVIIFSKYPIRDTVRVPYPGNSSFHSTESLIAADLDINGKTIRIFTTHLQSVLFQSKDFRDIEIIKNVDDSVLEASRSIVKKLKRAYNLRSSQADLVREELDHSPYPAIICGDFNDLPNSYTYFHIRGNRQDAFIQKGFGIGRTYIHLSPTLRIDYIMADKQFEVLQCRKFRLPYSDHHPVVADLQLSPSQP